MNSTELVNTLARKLQLSKAEVSRRLDEAVDLMTAELVKNNSVSFPNLGALEVKKREERINIHPSSGKRMLVPPRLVVKFKPVNAFKERLKKIQL